MKKLFNLDQIYNDKCGHYRDCGCAVRIQQLSNKMFVLIWAVIFLGAYAILKKPQSGKRRMRHK